MASGSLYRTRSRPRFFSSADCPAPCAARPGARSGLPRSA